MENSILLSRFMGYEAALKTIESRSFRVGRLRELNDPFEWRVGMKGYVPEAESIVHSSMNSFIDEMSSKFGVICMSGTHEDPVLWSHYADNHRGVAFEVDYLINEALMKVEYSNDRPVMDVDWIRDMESFSDRMRPLFLKMYRQKASSWSYEREYRVYVDLNDCDPIGGHYFSRIPEDFLKRVVLGFRCPLEVAYVQKALEKTGMGDVVVARAKLDQTSYKILS